MTGGLFGLNTKSSRTIQGSKVTVTTTQTEIIAQYSPEQIIAEAQKAAVVAEAQLEGDVAQVTAINADRKRFNDIVMAVAVYATGKDLGRTVKQWRDALAGQMNYRKKTPKQPDKPTFTEMIPIAYNPVVVPRLSFMTHTSTYSYVDN